MAASAIILEHLARIRAFYEAAPTETGWAARRYRQLLAHYYNLLIPAEASVLEIGCGSGELLARIRAVLRRTAGVVDLITLGGIRVDFTQRIATGPAGAIVLTNREFDILQFLAERSNRIVHRDQLIQQVWGSISPGTRRSVDRAIAEELITHWLA